jgi:DNA polymerase
LEAVIDHVQRLKADGVRCLPVSAGVLANLTKPMPRIAAARANPTPLPLSSLSRLVPDWPTPEPSRPQRPDPSATSAGAAPLVLPTVQIAPVARGFEIETPAVNPFKEASAPATALTEDREEAMSRLRARALACQKCPHLAATRRNVVFGVGDIHSPLMFVGEAPGAEEDAQGEPFVGAAGQLLTKIIKTMGFSRETVYIANVLKCRPDTPGQTSGNRKPTSDEMKTCLPYLLEQIDLIRPTVIVALGVTAVEGLLGLATPIGKLRGNFQMLRGIPVMPTYHPSYLLHNEALTEKRKVWEDMLKVLAKLDRPVTEKQRSYFLRSP